MIENPGCSCYVMTPADVSIALAHLKSGKGYGFVGLYTLLTSFMDQISYMCFIHNIHFSLNHGFTPDSFILGTMILLPKVMNKYVCSSSN